MTSDLPAMGERLDVAKIIFGAFALPWHRRSAFTRALAVPFLLLLLLTLLEYLRAGSEIQGATWGLLALHPLVYVLFAVTCHRLVLLDIAADARLALPRWTWRETRFLWKGFAVWSFSFAPAFVGAFVLVFASSPWRSSPDAFISKFVPYLAMVPAFYIFSRFSLVLPAIAIERRVGLGWAWQLSQGNGWRIFLVIGVLPWIVGAPLQWALATFPSVAVKSGASVLTSLLLVVEISALSLAYRELAKHEIGVAPS